MVVVGKLESATTIVEAVGGVKLIVNRSGNVIVGTVHFSVVEVVLDIESTFLGTTTVVKAGKGLVSALESSQKDTAKNPRTIRTVAMNQKVSDRDLIERQPRP